MKKTTLNLIHSIVGMYESIETATLKNAYKIGEKLQKLDKDELKEAKAEMAKNANVKESTLAEYKRFYIALGTAQIELRKTNPDANIIEVALNSGLLYTKMQLLSKVAPLTIFEVLSNPQYLEQFKGLNTVEVENFKHLLNVQHQSILDAFSNAPKASFASFQEQLKIALAEANIDNADNEQEPAEIDFKAVVQTIMGENVDLSAFKSQDELINALAQVLADYTPIPLNDENSVIA